MIFAASISITVPMPWQRRQAPNAELNENDRGSSGGDIDAAVHAGHLLGIELFFAVDDGDQDRTACEFQGGL